MPPAASAGPRVTPPGCEQIGDTDAVRCAAHSESMDRGIAVLSSGAYGVNIVSKCLDQHNAVWAMSGLYDPRMPLQRSVVGNTGTDRSEYGVSSWRSDESIAENNPTLNLEDLTMPVTVSASSGIPNFNNLGPNPVVVVTEGAPYEFGSMVFTRELQVRTTFEGMDNFHYRYDIIGARDRDTWVRAALDEGGARRFLDQVSDSDGGGADGAAGSSGGSSVSSGLGASS